MDHSFTQARGERARQKAAKAQNSLPPNASAPASIPSEAEEEDPEMDRLWEQWETEPPTPEELAAVERDREALKELQKIYPEADHAYARRAARTYTEEELEAMRQATREAVAKQKKR